MKKTQPPEQRFHAKVNKEVSQTFWNGTRCHEWQGYIAPNGYGNFRMGNRTEYTHRVAYELEHGPILDWSHVCHHCDNRRCVNPDHLFLGDRKANMQDALKKGRMAKGIRLPQAKLTEAEVLEIRASHEKQQILADRYGVTNSQISMIKSRKSWSHI